MTLKEATWLQGLMDDLGIKHDFLKVNCDSMSDIYLAKNQVCHERMKYIGVRFYFNREIHDEGDIELKKIHMKDNVVDMLNKVVPEVKFTHCNKLLHILLVI